MGKENKKLVGEIELFRFIFCVLIFLRHAEYLLGENKYFPGASFGVEFFFLVSGYLMMASIDKFKERPIENLSKETGNFIWRKASAIWLEIIVSFLIAFVVQCEAQNLSLYEIKELFAAGFFEMTLMQSTGVGYLCVNSVVWYVNAMLLCMVILYPLIRKYPEMMKRIVCPVLGLLLLGYLIQNFGHLRYPTNWIGFTFRGNIRAMAEICIGVACYPIVGALKQLQLKKFAKIIITIVKWGCWGNLIAYMYYVENGYKQDAFAFVLMCLAVVLAFSMQGIDAPLYQNSFVVFLGKFSLPLYLNHIYFSRYLSKLLPNNITDNEKMCVYVGVSVFTALMVMVIVRGIRKMSPQIRAFFKNLFLEEVSDNSKM